MKKVFLSVLLFSVFAASPLRAAEEPKLPVAGREDALTFARFQSAAGRHLMLVSSYEAGKVTGIDLTALLGAEMDDPITVYRTLGYDALAAMEGPAIVTDVDRLVLPVDLTASHIAAGTNFPAHAEEASVDEGPFLFAKEVTPTAFNAPIPAAPGVLLDYEVELCVVALKTFPVDTPPDRAGLMMCNDVTDRASLMRHLDPFDVASGKGFTTGKSAPGYLPVGSLFVIPRDLRAFMPGIELRLYRNGELAQSARQSQAIWDFDEILNQARLRADIRWDYQDRKVGLPLPNGEVPARTAILAGTPDGTIFAGIDTMAMVMGSVDWLLGGWDRSIAYWIVERQIARAAAEGQYLQPGERVQIRADFLGELNNPIVE
ncbi:MAG: fumarylacetoacetate hydrolase family protein [Parvibaculaceae bacterium]